MSASWPLQRVPCGQPRFSQERPIERRFESTTVDVGSFATAAPPTRCFDAHDRATHPQPRRLPVGRTPRSQLTRLSEADQRSPWGIPTTPPSPLAQRTIQCFLRPVRRVAVEPFQHGLSRSEDAPGRPARHNIGGDDLQVFSQVYPRALPVRARRSPGGVLQDYPIERRNTWTSS